MNNLLTHYPVNWIDGMKLSSSHFIAVQDFVTDSVRDAIALQTTDLQLWLTTDWVEENKKELYEEYKLHTMAFFVGLQTTSDNEAATDYSIENGIEIYNKSIGVFQKKGLVEEEVSFTLGHEFFHTLGVYHTHKDTRERKEGKIVYPNKKYVFARNYTTNLMSYTDLLAPYPCYSTWCWQWAIVNPAIKIEIENEKRR